MMGWAVNSIAEAVEGSIPFLPMVRLIILIFIKRLFNNPKPSILTPVLTFIVIII